MKQELDNNAYLLEDAQSKVAESEESIRKRTLGNLAYVFDCLILKHVIPDYEDKAIYTTKQLIKRLNELTEEEQERWKKLQVQIKFSEKRHGAALKRLKELRMEEAHPQLLSPDELRKCADILFGKSIAPVHEIITMYQELPK